MKSMNAAASEPNRRLWLILLAIVLGRFVAATAYRSASQSGLRFVDFPQFYTAAQAFRSHGLIYPTSRTGYPYSPVMAILLGPLTRLPMAAARDVWAAACVAMLFATAGLFSIAERLNVWSRPVLPLLFTVTVFRTWPTTIELGVGNDDILLLCILSGIYVAESRDRPEASGVLIALGALVKTWFILLLLYPLLRRQWRAACVGVATYAAGLALSFTIVGWWQLPHFVRVTRSYSWQPELVTQSLPGVAKIFLSANPHVTPFVDSLLLARLVTVLGVAGLVGGYCWAANRARAIRSSRPLLISLTMMTTLLTIPVCHQCYYVLAVPAVWALWTHGSRLGLSVATLCYAVLSVPTPGLTPVPAAFRHFPSSVGVATTFLTGLALWITMVVVLWRTGPTSARAMAGGRAGGAAPPAS